MTLDVPLQRPPGKTTRKMEVDLSALDVGMQLRVQKELDDLLKQEALFMELEQIEAARENYNTTLRSIDGVGQQVLAISKTAFIYYKAIEQLDFSSPRDIKWLTTRYPEMKVNCKGVRNQFGYVGAAPAKQQLCPTKTKGFFRGRETNVRETVRYPEGRAPQVPEIKMGTPGTRPSETETKTQTI